MPHGNLIAVAPDEQIGGFAVQVCSDAP